ncbi:MAG: glycosyltransferase family 4 protein [Fimbriimonadia bacterium]
MERHARDVAEGLVARGHSVTVWTTAHPAESGCHSNESVFIRYFPDTAPGLHSREFNQAVVQALAEDHSFDLMLVESRSAEAALDRLRPPQRPPAIMFIHGTEVSEELSIIAFDRGPGRYLRLLTQRLPAMLRSLARPRAHFAAERVVCVSQYVADHLASVYLAPPEVLRVVRNGIPLPPMPTQADCRAAREHLGLPQDATIILCIGRLAPDKGFDNAIWAFGRVQRDYPCLLLIVGGGPDEERLRSLVASLGLGKVVRFAGEVPQAATPPYYAASDILLLPGVRYEGHPYVLVEGAAMGLAVIASDRAGLGSELAGEKIALTIRPGSVDDLADALRTLLGSAELRRRMGGALRRHAERHYTLDAMLDGIEAVMSELL